MMILALVGAVLIGGAAAPADVVPANPLVWAEIPQLPETCATLRSHGLGSLLEQFVSARQRQALSKLDGGSLVTALYPQRNGPRDWGVWLTAYPDISTLAQRLDDGWRQRGFHGATPGPGGDGSVRRFYRQQRELFGFTESGRLGYLTRKEWGSYLRGRAPDSLGRHEDYARVSRWAGAAVVRGRLDGKQFYGELARQPNASRVLGTVVRLGLDTFDGVDFKASLAGRGRIGGTLALRFDEPGKGLLSTLGTASGISRLQRLPKELIGLVRLSIRPGPLYDLLLRILSFRQPVQYSAVRMHLRQIGSRLNKLIGRDVLGERSQLWTWSWYRSDSGPAGAVLEAGVLDPVAAGSVIEALGALLQDIDPRAQLLQKELGKQPVWVLKTPGAELVAAVGSGKVVLASSLAVLRAHRSRAPLVWGRRDQAAVAVGVHRGGSGLVEWLSTGDPLAASFAATLSYLGVSKESFGKTFRRFDWWMAPSSTGLEADWLLLGPSAGQ